MREALNSNPVVQIAVVGVLFVVVGLFMMTGLKKKDAGSASSSATPATSSPTAGATATPTPAPSTASAGAATATPPPSVGVTPDALVPGPGLPRPVVSAWKSGDAVVLLIVRGSGTDDKLVRRSVDSLSGDSNVAVFVAKAQNVARYSRITQGVGVDRTPALIVVRPLEASGSVPQAQVSYGFRNSQSVVQAVHDALYEGPDNLPYYPK